MDTGKECQWFSHQEEMHVNHAHPGSRESKCCSRSYAPSQEKLPVLAGRGGGTGLSPYVTTSHLSFLMKPERNPQQVTKPNEESEGSPSALRGSTELMSMSL